MCSLMEKLAHWIKYKRLRADNTKYEERYNAEDAKAIRKALRQPVQRKLVRFMEQKDWTMVCRILREDHATQQVFSSLSGTVLSAVYLPTRPPLDLVLDWIVSEKNVLHWFLIRDLLVKYGDHRVRILHALLRHTRPNGLKFKPKLYHNTLTDNFRFSLEVSICDPRRNEAIMLDVGNVFYQCHHCCTYTLLTESGFKTERVEYIPSTDEPLEIRSLNQIRYLNFIAKRMGNYCHKVETNCSSLASLARNTVRSHMVSLDMRYFHQLGLPVEVERYLTLEYLDCPEFAQYRGQCPALISYHDFFACKGVYNPNGFTVQNACVYSSPQLLVNVG